MSELTEVSDSPAAGQVPPTTAQVAPGTEGDSPDSVQEGSPSLIREDSFTDPFSQLAPLERIEAKVDIILSAMQNIYAQVEGMMGGPMGGFMSALMGGTPQETDDPTETL